MSTKTATTKSAKSGQDRADKLAELHAQITDGVGALVETGGWQAMLSAAARFHSYSLNNLLLIGAQAPQASRVAGFRTWQSLGRQVRKGERGIAILAPCTYGPKKSEPAEGDAQELAEQGTHGPWQLRGFRPAYVFDLAQTDGDPLPDVAPELLTGQAPSGLWDALAEQVTGHGYSLQRGDCGSANGWTDPTSRTVRVRDGLEEAQAVKTLAHELGHLECGHVQDLPTCAMCRGRCEVEAESVAYVVTAASGLDTAGYTFAYVAGWAGRDLTVVRQSAETVTRAARSILDRLDQPAADGQAA